MAASYTTPAYLTDGVSRSARAVLLLPAAGFTQSDHTPYSIENIVKRIFIFADLGSFPWLMQVYTRKVHNRIHFLITLTVAASRRIVLFGTMDRTKPIWLIFLNHCFAGKKESVQDDTEEEIQLEILT